MSLSMLGCQILRFMFCLASALFVCKLGFLGKDLRTHDLAYGTQDELMRTQTCSSMRDVVTQKP